LLFDVKRQGIFIPTLKYFNECFLDRHNALHYFDQRCYLADKELSQPLQVNDFDATHAQQVRNLYLSPSEMVRSNYNPELNEAATSRG
jgi:hypothetical protein